MTTASSRTVAEKVPWQLMVSEFVGTALLVAVGLSIVIFDFGRGSVMLITIPSPALRRALTGFLFGCVGASIAISPVGKSSGAHINPIVTLAFRLKGTLSNELAIGYVMAQLTGAIAGAFSLLFWGSIGRSVGFGVTTPSSSRGLRALAGETVCTYLLVLLLFVILGSKIIRKYAPLLFPPLYAVMVWLEAPLSGTSTNPARSLGPAVISGEWHGFWIYIVGPSIGCLLAVATLSFKWFRTLEIDIAKVYHFTLDKHEVLN